MARWDAWWWSRDEWLTDEERSTRRGGGGGSAEKNEASRCTDAGERDHATLRIE